MNREFLDLYNRELKILYERSKEFAEEFPGVAERLGGLIEDKMDPGLAGAIHLGTPRSALAELPSADPGRHSCAGHAAL